jgi:hypothetical protein
MQVSKGLKRATGRDEQFQHHLGTLNFCPFQLSSLPIFQTLSSRPERSARRGLLLRWILVADFRADTALHYVGSY